LGVLWNFKGLQTALADFSNISKFLPRTRSSVSRYTHRDRERSQAIPRLVGATPLDGFASLAMTAREAFARNPHEMHAIRIIRNLKIA
jgi:hypothetical protein